MIDRLVPLEGTLNFRDLGGYATHEGVTRWGVVYRADRLSGLTDDDLAELARRRVRTVCDLRYEREIDLDLDPSRLPEGSTRVLVPVGADLADTDKTIEERIRLGELQSVTSEQVAEGYLVMLERRPEQFARVVEVVAATGTDAVVVHCTEGKDRTGVVSALLLGAVGVGDDDIVADYALTDRYRSRRRLAEVGPRLESWGVDIDDLRPLFTTPAETMELTLAGIEERWGGVEGYLTGLAGLPPAVMDDLRATLVE